MRRNLLLVEDDHELRAHTCEYLQSHSFIVHEARDGREMDAALNREAIDLVVLDVMLPGESGLAICRRLAARDGPAILLMSALGEEIDRVLGLELGADGYLPKPCSPRELLAHIRAILRRRGDGRDEPASALPQAAPAVFRFAGFQVDFLRRQLTAPNDTAVLLTAGEFTLLSAFVESPRRVLSREDLAHAVRGSDAAFNERSVDVLVSRLRRKLHANCDRPLIQTQRGEGYVFNATVTP